MAEDETAAALKIQAVHRSRQARKDIEEQQGAALKIQAVHRSRQARREIEGQQGAALKIQAVHRSRQARREIEEQQGAALKIQAVHRGRKARRQAPGAAAVESPLDDNDLREQQGAALKIQAVHRSRQARREIEEQQGAALKIQAVHRSRQARREIEEQQGAALKIQAVHRGRKARRQAPGAAHPPPPALVVGQRVRANFAGKGHFYNGKVLAVNADGTYAIEYDDGDWEDNALPEHVATIARRGAGEAPSSPPTFEVHHADPADLAPPSPLPMLAVGQRVRANFAGKGHLYNGKVLSANADGTYAIEYDDGDWEDNALRENIAPIAASAPPPAARPPLANTVSAPTSGGDDAAVGRAVLAASPLSNTWDAGGMPPEPVVVPEDPGRPKSRRGRSRKPLQPTGRYPWQDDGQQEQQGEVHVHMEAAIAAAAPPSSHVQFLDEGSPSPPRASAPKARSPKASTAPPGGRPISWDSFIDRNKRAVAVVSSTKKGGSDRKLPTPPPTPDRSPEGPPRASNRPDWCHSVRPGSGGVGKRRRRQVHAALAAYRPSQAEVVSVARGRPGAGSSTSPPRRRSPQRRPASAPKATGTARRAAGVLEVDVRNAAYFFACKALEQSGGTKERGGCAGYAARVNEPRVYRLYKRESELFEAKAVAGRKALKALRASVRDKKKVEEACETLEREVQALVEEEKGAAGGRRPGARGAGPSSEGSLSPRAAAAVPPAAPLGWEIAALSRKAKMKILKRELGSGYERYATDLTLLFRRLREALTRPSKRSASGATFRFDDLEAYLTAESRREARERRHRERDQARRRRPWTRDNVADERKEEEARDDTLRLQIGEPALLKSLYLFCEDVVKTMSPHERAILLAHFDVDGKGTVDVREFMDSLRPALPERRQRVVDDAFRRFLATENALRVREAAQGADPAPDLADAVDVWCAYAAFRELTPAKSGRGHAALSILDERFRPCPEEAVRRSGLPDAAKGLVPRDEWDALHRALSLRVPSDDTFERLVEAAWAFAGEAGVGRKEGAGSERARFGLPERAAATTLSKLGPAVAEKAWDEYEDRRDGDDAPGRPYWHCAETGETTWEMPAPVRAERVAAARTAAIRRKREALRSLQGVSADIDRKLWECMGRFEVPGLDGRPLSLANLNLTELPHLWTRGGEFVNLFDNEEFTHVNLDGNKFGATEASFRALQCFFDTAYSVEELTMCNNGLETMPTGNGAALKRLRVLRLARNRIAEFPPAFPEGHLGRGGEAQREGFYAALAALEEADLSENCVARVPRHVAALAALRVLDLSGNRLERLPGEIGALAHLEQLNVARNELTVLPDAVAKLGALVRLDAQSNALAALPTSLGEGGGTALRQVNLAHNRLRGLPGSFCSLDSLVALDASDNRIESLPKDFGELGELRRLDLHKNALTTLPGSFYRLNRLEECFLNGNKGLMGLPEIRADGDDVVLQSIQVLCLQKCAIQHLPERLGRLGPGLVSFKAHENRLAELPESIGRLAGLRQLHLAGNQLEELPGSFRGLTALEDLTLHDNPGLSPSLLRVVLTGKFMAPEEVALRRCTSKIFDGIRTRWAEVESRMGLALKAKGRMAVPTGASRGGRAARQVAGAEGKAGGRPRRRSLSIVLRRFRDALFKFDSSSCGRLSPPEFARAIAAVGLFLTSDDCDLLSTYAKASCSDGAMVDIDAFVYALHQPPHAGGAAQAVVRFVQAAVTRREARLARGEQRRGERSERRPNSLGARERELEAQSRSLERKLNELSAEKRAARRKEHALKQYVAGEGPLPEWFRADQRRGAADRDESFGDVMVEVDDAGLPVRERIIERRAANERLATKRRSLQNEVRRKNALVRRLEGEAEAKQQQRQQEPHAGGAEPPNARAGKTERLRKLRQKLLAQDVNGVEMDLTADISDRPKSKERVQRKLREKQSRDRRQQQELRERQEAVRSQREERARKKDAGAKRRATKRRVASEEPKAAEAEAKAATKAAPAPAGPVRVNLSIMGTAAAPFSLIAAPDETVADLKAKVEFREGIPAGRQTLFHRQKRLKDATTMAKARIRAGDMVHIVLKKGGR